MRKTIRILTGIGFATALATPAVATDPSAKCEAAKLKETGKYSLCRLKAEAKSVKTGQPADYATCDTKLTLKFQSAELLAGPGVCPTESDEAAIRAQAAADAGNRASQLSGQRFIDNGDLTITDTLTGLQWEQKTTDASVHAIGADYALSDDEDDLDGTDPDGTAYTVFLSALNDCQSVDGTAGSGGFAGYCDWRLPTNDELRSLLLAPYPCPVHPCVDPILGPTPSYFTWSVTNHATLGPLNAWGVDFFDGRIDYGEKPFRNYVRAVRRAW